VKPQLVEDGVDQLIDVLAEQIPALVAAHWSFLLVALGLSIVGEFFKRYVWTRERAVKGKIWLWGRRTLPFHPVMVGLAIDLVVGEIYYTGSGILAIWLFDVARQEAKQKFDIELSLWRTSKEPSDPPSKPGPKK